jgi:hypothetical protein
MRRLLLVLGLGLVLFSSGCCEPCCGPCGGCARVEPCSPCGGYARAYQPVACGPVAYGPVTGPVASTCAACAPYSPPPALPPR